MFPTHNHLPSRDFSIGGCSAERGLGSLDRHPLETVDKSRAAVRCSIRASSGCCSLSEKLGLRWLASGFGHQLSGDSAICCIRQRLVRRGRSSKLRLVDVDTRDGRSPVGGRGSLLAFSPEICLAVRRGLRMVAREKEIKTPRERVAVQSWSLEFEARIRRRSDRGGDA
ncbi:histone deacetylase superfamily [Striga asiatica]|uniref:Histone deacetylase superfamily n=1 Tax=Striga asiatica TaxID=4170 RepID=A0A5A7PRR9_STRAF|nr:histone deacetylase superfamily [Striga asiatica]